MFEMRIWPIREALSADRNDLRNFFWTIDGKSRYQYFNGHVTESDVNRVCFYSDDIFFIVEYCGNIVGVCQLSANGNKGQLSVVVHPNYRKRGIGNVLTDRAINWFKTHGVTEVSVYSQPDASLISRTIQRNGLTPLILTGSAEAKFTLPAVDPVAMQREIASWFAGLYYAWVKHTLFRALSY